MVEIGPIEGTETCLVMTRAALRRGCVEIGPIEGTETNGCALIATSMPSMSRSAELRNVPRMLMGRRAEQIWDKVSSTVPRRVASMLSSVIWNSHVLATTILARTTRLKVQSDIGVPLCCSKVCFTRLSNSTEPCAQHNCLILSP